MVSSDRSNRIWVRADTWRAAFLVIAVGFVCLAAFAPGLAGYDDALYIVVAKSIATGQGLRLINVVGSPPATHYPFGLPLLLAPVFYFLPSFPENLPALVLVSFLPWVLSTAIVYLLLTLRADVRPGLAALIAAVAAVNSHTILVMTAGVSSEPAYTFFSALALLLLGVWERQERLFNACLLLGVAFMVFSYFVRTVGTSLVLACFVFFLVRRDFRRLLPFAATTLLLISPWMYRNLSVGTSPIAQDYQRIFWLKDWLQPQLGYVHGPLDILVRILRNAGGHVTDSLSTLLLPLATFSDAWLFRRFLASNAPWVPNVLGLMIAGLMAFGFVKRMRHDGSMLEFYVLFYCGTILLAPWRIPWNLVPILPILLYYLVVGLSLIVSRFSFRPGTSFSHPNWLAILILSVFLVTNLVSVRHLWAQGLSLRSRDIPHRLPQGLLEVGTWFKSHTAEDALVLFWSPEKLYLVSDRRTSAAFAGNTSIPIGGRDIDDVLAEVRQNIDYVVLEPSSGQAPALDQAVSAHPEWFQPVFETVDEPKHVVYRVRPDF